MSLAKRGVDNDLGVRPGQVLDIRYEALDGTIKDVRFQIVKTSDDYFWGFRESNPDANLRFNPYAGTLQRTVGQTDQWSDVATVLEVGLACAVPLEVS